LKEAEFIVKPLTDADMLRVMLLENDTEGGMRTTGSVLIEGVEALVNAIAAGTLTVELPAKTNNDWVRHAPSYRAGVSVRSERTHPYTIESIALFLGKTKNDGKASNSVFSVVNALEAVEMKLLTRAAIDNVATPAPTKISKNCTGDFAIGPTPWESAVRPRSRAGGALSKTGQGSVAARRRRDEPSEIGPNPAAERRRECWMGTQTEPRRL
jgi:hypothetical protein